MNIIIQCTFIAWFCKSPHQILEPSFLVTAVLPPPLQLVRGFSLFVALFLRNELSAVQTEPYPANLRINEGVCHIQVYKKLPPPTHIFVHVHVYHSICFISYVHNVHVYTCTHTCTCTCIQYVHVHVPNVHSFLKFQIVWAVLNCSIFIVNSVHLDHLFPTTSG